VPPSTILEAYLQAREYFKTNGGAIQDFADETGRVCALGAMNRICAGDPTRRPLGDASYIINQWYEPLVNAAEELYGDGIVEVNDKLGVQQVLDCYDLAIKYLEEKEKGI
jgi:hypothetical protein